MNETVRQTDTLARLGGDEFGVLMRFCSLEQSQRLAESLRKKVEEFRFDVNRVRRDWDFDLQNYGAYLGAEHDATD